MQIPFINQVEIGGKFVELKKIPEGEKGKKQEYHSR